MYRRASKEIKSILWQSDLFKYLELWGGEHFDEHLYGFETNSLLELSTSSPTRDDIEQHLLILAKSKDIEVSLDKVHKVSFEIHILLCNL